MNKFLVLILSLLVLACVSSPASQTDSQVYCIPTETRWNIYVFDVYSGHAYGKAFIADYGIWSAKHIFEEDRGSSDDIKFMGPVEFEGLTLCKHEVKLNDMLYYRANGKIKYMFVAHIEDSFFGVLTLDSIECGDSGSPVMSLKDGEVVGIVSHSLSRHNGKSFGGEISRIKTAVIKDE